MCIYEAVSQYFCLSIVQIHLPVLIFEFSPQLQCRLTLLRRKPTFLSRVSILLLTRDIDIVILSVCPSVCP